VRTTNHKGGGARAAFTRVELTLSQECSYTFSSQMNPPALLIELIAGGKSVASRAGGGSYGGGASGTTTSSGAATSAASGGGASGGATSGAISSGGTSSQPAVSDPQRLGMKTIMVDPGHGGKDPGTAHNGIKESTLVLKLAKMVGAKLKSKGFNVLYTRESDKYISLQKRSEMANTQRADMFLSLHVNGNEDSQIWGVEAYYLDVARSRGAMRVAARENAVTEKEIAELQVILADLLLNTKTGESKELAALMLRNMDRSLKGAGYPVRNNGVRSAPFYVLMGVHMPSVLVEVGYATNAAEAKRLLSDKYLNTLADGIVSGIVAYRNKLNGGG
jgi:N-acetylmuramoyl-L-alanine amidase